MSAIAKIYAKKVNAGERTIDSVPESILDEVKGILGITDDETGDVVVDETAVE